MRQIIYLAPKDNIATIREKLEHVQAQEVLLVIPPRYQELRNLVNLKLLQRYARDLAIDLALVVRDGPTKTLAREVGLVLTSNVEKGRKIELKPRRKAKGAQASPAERGESEPSPRPSGVPYTPKRQGGVLGRALALVFVLAVLGALSVGFVYLVLPSAVVSLQPAAEELEVQMEIIAVPGLADTDYGQGRIPARTVSVELEGTGNTPATGKEDIPDAHAEGTVVFANKTNSPVTVPKNTLVRTSSGAPIRFYTVTDLELPGEWGAHGRVKVIAVDAGPRGNVKALTINEVEGDASFRVDVINDEPTTGGGLRRVSKVTAEDVGRVKNALLQRMHQEAMTKLQGQLSETEFIPAESLSIDVMEETYDPSLGQVADNLSLRLKVTASGTVVGGEEANLLLLRMLESRVPEGFALTAESLRFGQPEPLRAAEDGIHFRMSASCLAVSNVAASEIRRELAGKSVAEAQDYLLERWQFAQEPELTVSPEWIGRIPWIPYRIEVKIEVPPTS